MTRVAALAVPLAAIFAAPAAAADGTWTGTAGDGLWVTPSNWVNDVVPGTTDGTYVSSDIATFSAPTAPAVIDPYPLVTVTVDPNRNVSGLTFDNINTTSFAIGTSTGEALHLTGGGVTRVTSNITNTSTTAGAQFTLPAPLVIHGNRYSFINDATQNNTALRPMGTIAFTGTGPSTLTLAGTNNNGNQGPSQVWSGLTDQAGGALGVVKNGTGTWELYARSTSAVPFNTYSGDTVVNGGFLRIRGDEVTAGSGNLTSSGASPNSNYIASGGVIRFSTNGLTIKSISLNDPTVAQSAGFNSSNASVIVNIKNETGPGLVMNYNATPVSTSTTNAHFTGSVPGQGGIELNNLGNAIGVVTLGDSSRSYNLGTVQRPIDVERGAEANSADLRLSSIVSGTGGILKLGNGRLRFDNVSNPITGVFEVREGTLLVNNSGGLSGIPSLLVSGGTFHVNGGHTHTFTGVTVSKGAITASAGTSTVLAPTYSLAVANAADTATIAAVLGDSGGASTLTKTGPGTASLTGANTYTGVTTVAAGTLRLDTADADDIILNGPAGANITGGRIAFDYTGGSPAGTIVPLLDAGYSNNFSTGPIRSSTATSNRGLGYADNGTSTFTVAYTIYGDTNLDSAVNFDDLLALAQNYGGAGDKTWSQGDINYDNAVNFDDLLGLAQNYGTSLLADGGLGLNGAMAANFAGDWALAQSLVPEPASLGIALGAAAVFGRRRRSETGR